MAIHDPEKEVISLEIARHGCYECDVLHSLLRALQNSTGASLIDMGGNIGLYSLHAASLGRRAVAFDVVKTLF